MRKTLILKVVQWAVRFLQGTCAASVLALTCYFIATQDNRELKIHKWERAVAGISGAALVHVIVQALLLCCLAGFIISSGITILLDLLFVAGFIYAAWALRDGTASCSNAMVHTPWGTGRPEWEISEHVGGNDGWTRLPTYKQGCQMQKAALACAVLAIFVFAIGIFVEWTIIKARKDEKRASTVPVAGHGKGLFGFRRNKKASSPVVGPPASDVEAAGRDAEKA